MRTWLVLVVVTGCSAQPKSPGADGARTAYTQRAGKIAELEAAVTPFLDTPDRKTVIDRAIRDAGAHRCESWTGKPGNVHPDEPEALRLDGRRIGWGLYQIVEGEAWHPAIQVMSLEIEMCFTLDGA